MTAHPPAHWLVYGDPGSAKSSFAAAFPKPMLVFSWDPIGKDTPYSVDPATRQPRGEISGLGVTEHGATYYDVTSRKTGKLLTRVERWHNANAENYPDAYIRFLSRMHGFNTEYEQWATVCIDSLSGMELASRMSHQFILNVNAKGEGKKQWFGGSTDDLERMVIVRCGSLPMNVVVIAHMDKDKDEFHGRFINTVAAPGRLKTRNGLAAAFGEIYRAFPLRDDATKTTTYWLQTRADGSYIAASQIGAPDPCPTTYAALWSAS